MTVKELKEQLNKFDDNLVVMIPNPNWHPFGNSPTKVVASSVAKGVNEMDGCVFIED